GGAGRVELVCARASLPAAAAGADRVPGPRRTRPARRAQGLLAGCNSAGAVEGRGIPRTDHGAPGAATGLQGSVRGARPAPVAWVQGESVVERSQGRHPLPPRSPRSAHSASDGGDPAARACGPGTRSVLHVAMAVSVN